MVFPNSIFFGKLFLLSRTGVSLLMMMWMWIEEQDGRRRNTNKCLNEILPFLFLRGLFCCGVQFTFFRYIFSSFFQWQTSVRMYRFNQNL